MDCTLKQMASDWDADRYHRVSDPQVAWGLGVLERLRPQPGEWILDLGSGTGRLTVAIRQRAAGARVIGTDRSWSMLSEARRRAHGFQGVQADATALPFREAFDAVFSTATFHWIADHPRLFAEIHQALVRGGRLVAQAGGEGNLARLRRRSAELSQGAEFSPYFEGWTDPWNYASVAETERRLLDAGFTEVEVSLESAPTTFDTAGEFDEFVTTVCLRTELDRLPPDAKRPYIQGILSAAAGDDPPFTLDYWRLNIDARRP